MESWLNKTNIENSVGAIEHHPLRPFLPSNAKVLFLGSFPPPRKRWCIDFFYPNFINDHWRIEGEVFYHDKLHFVDDANKAFKGDEVIEHCMLKGIAFFDTATAVKRLKDNASDKFLEVVEATDISSLVNQLPQLRAIVVTGEKAAQTLAESLGMEVVPKVNEACPIASLTEATRHVIELYRLPSSSRAYPMSLAKKAESYRAMFERYGYV